uniref:interleukin-1 receptor-associated kinase 4-like isoform X2 n=1 Tax=Myxine glutinosa TaxID=7769 RepID=UPI00358EEAC5
MAMAAAEMKKGKAVAASSSKNTSKVKDFWYKNICGEIRSPAGAAEADAQTFAVESVVSDQVKVEAEKQQEKYKAFLRSLRPSELHGLAGLLDPDDNWRVLAAHIRNSGGELRYSMVHIRKFEDVRRSGRSPTVELLCDWGTTNITVGQLHQVLCESGFTSAAVTLLPGVPLPDAAPSEKADSHSIWVVQCSDDLLKKENIDARQPCSSNTRAAAPTMVCAEPCNDLLKKNEHLSSNFCNRTHSDTCGVTEVEAYGDVQPVEFSTLLRITKNFNNDPVKEGGSWLGEGGFGVVYLGHLYDKLVAVKKLSNFEEGSDVMRKQFRQEIHTLARCRHENLVELLGFSFDGPQLCLVYAYMLGGCLTNRLTCTDEFTSLSWATRLNVAADMSRGLAFLHQKNHVHRDIKSSNVLLDENMVAKLADFGLVRTGKAGGATALTSTVVGTTVYMAPEAMRGEIVTISDVYSLGVVFLELLTGLAPYDEQREPVLLSSLVEELEEEARTIDEVMDQRMGMVDPKALESFFDLACRCLAERKRKRPSAAEVLQEVQGVSTL